MGNESAAENTTSRGYSSTRGRLTFKDVSKRYDTAQAELTVLDDVNLEISSGEFLSLLGPSGCGKSTLLEIAAGLQAPTDGEVLLDGRAVTKPGPDRTVVFQHYALFPWLTAVENVAFPLRVGGQDKVTQREKSREALDLVGLRGFEDTYANGLSGGMQQRVAIARALVCDPSILLMDEPFSGADAITRELLQEELHRIHKQRRTTTLFVTHSVSEALGLSDRVVVLGTRPGKIVRIVELDRERLDALSAAERESELAELHAEIWELLKEIIAAGGAYGARVGSAPNGAGQKGGVPSGRGRR